MATRAGKTAEAAIKQIATQELQAEKGKNARMETDDYAGGCARAAGYQNIRLSYEGAIEAQRQRFEMELERVREKLHQMELRSPTLENEVNSRKAQQQTLSQRPAQDTPPTTKSPSVPASIKPIKGEKKQLTLIKKNYAQIAASSSARNTT